MIWMCCRSGSAHGRKAVEADPGLGSGLPWWMDPRLHHYEKFDSPLLDEVEVVWIVIVVQGNRGCAGRWQQVFGH